MSDFLNKFSKQDYKDEHKEKKEESVTANETVTETFKSETVSTPIKENLPIVENTVGSSLKGDVPIVENTVKETVIVSKKRSSHQEPEEVHIDPSYKRNQRNKIIGGAVAVVILLLIAFGAYYLINQVKVPDYANQPFSELKTWATRNNIALETDYEFSLEVSKDYVIRTDPLANVNVQKGSILRVVVSSGADPDELITVPDFTGNSYSQIQEWLNTNKINNLRITYENNDEITVNQFVKIVFNDKNITSDSYHRKDYGLIYISNGPVVYEKNIEVPDWTTKNEQVGVVESWGIEKDVKIVVIQVNSATVPLNGVISQSVSPKSMVSKKSTITVSISLGQVVKVPDFSKMSKEEAEPFLLSLEKYNATGRFIEMYQPKGGATYGNNIWQDVKAGTNISQSSTTKLVVTVYYSLGQPYLSSLVGSAESVIPSTIYTFNQDAANFTYTINYVNSASAKGEIVSMSPSSQYVDPGQHIVFEVSTGTP